VHGPPWSPASIPRSGAETTGAVGSRLIPLLVSAGHSVLGLTRTPGKAEAIRRVAQTWQSSMHSMGPAVREAVIGAKPDVIVHEMTALNGVSDLRRFDRVFALTNRLRTEGLDHLLAAAKQTGTRRVVAQSFGGWPFCADWWRGKDRGGSLGSRAAKAAATHA
jgi:2-alkyl-3-oxoalkanoate reductase